MGSNQIKITDGCIWMIQNPEKKLLLHSDCADNHYCRWDNARSAFQIEIDRKWQDSHINLWGAAWFTNPEDSLDTPEQSEFVEDFIKNWTVRYRSRGGALSLAQEWALKEEAQLIEAEIIKRTNLLEKSIEFYSKELEKLERRIEEVERGNYE